MSCHRNYNYSDTKNNGRYPQNGGRNMQPMKLQPDEDTTKQNGARDGAIASPMPMLPLEMPPPTTVTSTYYTAGFLKQFLGRNMRVEFLIGTGGALVDRVGVLVEVGASYIVLQPYLTDDLLMCDLYSIKFVYIYE